ncbi:MAG: hypothetical protein IPG70_07670, partial [Moraxellaceae bacterium]|nr:hypothetical protein [Moraxellaceae bacterium]
MADEDSLMAVIMAQAMNHGNFSMAETGDIPYHFVGRYASTVFKISDFKSGK